MPALTLKDIQAGDTLIADGGFTCLKDGAERVVKLDTDNLPYIECAQGCHHLAGQENEQGLLVGLSRKPQTPDPDQND